MLANKHVGIFVSLLMTAAVLCCLFVSAFPDSVSALTGDSSENTGVSMEYESKLFDTDEILDINILIDEDDWNSLLENAIDEEYTECDVTINGTTFSHVGIRPKGNTSLSSIVNDPDTDRYSFKLEFDHYVDGQTCYGLDQLVLNNNYADASSMKEALVYDMYQYLGADASLYNYAKISVNGEYWGVYLALEAVDDSFRLRCFGTENGALYKPEGVGGMGGPGENGNDAAAPGGDGQEPPQRPDENPNDQDSDSGQEPPQRPDENPNDQDSNGGQEPPQRPDENPNDQDSDSGQEPPQQSDENQDAQDSDGRQEPPQQSGGGGPQGDSGFVMGGSGGADLNYTDDDLDSYSTIWDGAKTDVSKKDRKRVVTALKNISEGNDLETYMDTDNLLKYMAVHIFSVNEDSLSGNMAHNYYLYESGGQLNLIPWDYNLAFGGMGGSSATSVVNSPIDDAFSATDFFDTLMEDEEYHSAYYENLRTLVEDYINGGAFDAFYERVRSQIDSLVESDPTAFYSYEEYEEAADTLYQLVKLRGESILKQIDGTIPSTESGQAALSEEESSVLVDASSLDLSVLGQMNTQNPGQGGPGQPGGEPDQNFPHNTNNEAEADPPSNPNDIAAKGETSGSEDNISAPNGTAAGVQTDAASSATDPEENPT